MEMTGISLEATLMIKSKHSYQMPLFDDNLHKFLNVFYLKTVLDFSWNQDSSKEIFW